MPPSNPMDKAIEKLVEEAENAASEGFDFGKSGISQVVGSIKEASFIRGIGVTCRHCQGFNSHNHSFFSVMDGISSPEAMVDYSAMRGFGGMGLTDHGTMGGILRAGKAGKAWLVGRKKATGKLFNYREVDLSAYTAKYELSRGDFSPFSDPGTMRVVLGHLPKAWVEQHPREERKYRIVTRDERAVRQEDKNIREIDLDQAILNAAIELCDDRWQTLDLSEVAPFIGTFKKSVVEHSPDHPHRFRILSKNEYEKVGDFKVVSGCELYVSWKDKKDAKYHHITVYATGETGHRALVLLTSIGSIPSRRYLGARGFFRPRIFMEDLEVAVGVAAGELVVTTGCPISITSEALRRGDLGEARRFFEWGKRVLPPGRFFAELHLCDVSLDWNSRYAKAEDRFYSSLFNTPISRFRHEDREIALKYSQEFLSDLRVFVLGESLRGFKVENAGSVRNSLQEQHFDLSSPEGVALAREYQNTGIVHPLIEAGITSDIRDIFPKSIFDSIPNITNAVMEEADALLTAGRMIQETDESEGGNSNKTAPTKNVGDKTLVKIGGGKSVQLLDEDTLTLLSTAIQVVEKSKLVTREKRPQFTAASMLAKFAIFVITRIAREDSTLHVNPLEVIRAFLHVPAKHRLGDEGDGAILSEIATDRLLLLGEALHGLDEEILFAAARSIFALLRGDGFNLEKELAPGCGAEDGLEKEWVTHPEGNWMEKVNASLTHLAREYDVPLLLATDSHMVHPDLKPVQDAIIKRGKRRGWHMSRPYAIPRSDLKGLIEDLGRSYNDGDPEKKNAAHKMIEAGAISLDDIVESIGSGSLLLDDVKAVGTFKWKTAVPRIKYETHPFYAEAKALLESGELKEFLESSPIVTGGAIKFSEASIDLPTALVVTTFVRAIDEGLIPDDEAYLKRIFSEIYLQQEVPNEKLADFFIIIQTMITRWRKRGVSVGPGRGSSGGMLTAMISGITYADPIKKGFLESRWMNRGRKAKGAHADIDIDVSDRQVAGYELALLAREAFQDTIVARPLDPLEEILHGEIFYSSAPVTHESIGGVLREVEAAKKDLSVGFAKAVGASVSTYREISQGTQHHEATANSGQSDEIEADSIANLLAAKDDGITVWGAPIVRVGTYGSLKAKAAVKEAIRIADNTPFDLLPSFAEPPQSWLLKNKSFFLTEGEIASGITEDEKKNRLYEDEKWGHLPLKEREARRRVKLGDRITKEMSANSGLARLYQNEYDYFMGSVYGVTPEYWDLAQRPPSGSPEAKQYFERNPDVKKLVLDMLNIYKSQGVHAGGFCIGRELFERIPVRADKHGYVSQFEMKDIEAVGILKFDVLGLETLNQISQTLKFIVEEEPYENLSWWLPKAIYERVRSGESTDIMWRHMPPSTKEAIDVMCRNRAMTFQIDTKVFGKELDKLNPESVARIIQKHGDERAVKNDRLTDILNAFLALFRPGPMKLNSHVEYIERLMGKPYTVLHPWMEPFVRDTFGLIVYQEQVMAIYRAAAIQLGESGEPLRDHTGQYVLASEEETDEVRRALGKKDMSALAKMSAQQKFMDGLAVQKVPREVAKTIWETIEPFAEYGFNAPHSLHYAVISATSIFLKAHYTKYFFRVTMGLANTNDAARFLSEIQKSTRIPCVLRSGELFWEVLGKEYFPGLSSIEGLKTKEIKRILAAQKACREEEANTGRPTDAEMFFKHLGPMTKSFATIIARSGALRVFGTTHEISDGYRRAMLGHLEKSQAAKKDALNKALTKAGDEGEKFPRDREETESRHHDLFDSLVFAPLNKEAQEAQAVDELKIEATVQNSGSPRTGRAKKPKSEKPLKLGKTDEEVCNILKSRGIAFVEGSYDEKTGVGKRVLTVASALDMVLSNKTKGSGIKHLVEALAEERKRASVEDTKSDTKNHTRNGRRDQGTSPAFVMIKNLKSLTTDSGKVLPFDQVYRTVAIPKSIASPNEKGGEPRVTFLAEGSEINAKFTKDYDTKLKDDQLVMLKDGKMTTPFIIDVYVGRFQPRDSDEQITYYRITRLEKLGNGD